MNRILFVSQVPKHILKKTLFRAYAIGSFALCCLFLMIITPLSNAQNLFCFAFFLTIVVASFKPYKKLQKLHKVPIQVYATIDSLHLPYLSIPFKKIKKICFKNNKKKIGIEITHEQGIVFLPFFSQADCDQLQEIMQDLLLQDRANAQDLLHNHYS